MLPQFLHPDRQSDVMAAVHKSEVGTKVVDDSTLESVITGGGGGVKKRVAH